MARSPFDSLKLALEKRDLARRARRLAVTQRPADQARLIQYADELDKEAADLERQASQRTGAPIVVHQQQQLEGVPPSDGKTSPAPPPPVVVEQQQQQQQQQQHEGIGPPEPEDRKD